jgi:hypothetical protein
MGFKFYVNALLQGALFAGSLYAEGLMQGTKLIFCHFLSSQKPNLPASRLVTFAL